ncbi:MAG: hypothetical protein K0V04_45140 [Deltaproteobacteria bacterium]|nr:hypothetical protein [Deltaproteobacteria bacterium]
MSRPTASGLSPYFVKQELRGYLGCGILARGILYDETSKVTNQAVEESVGT